MCTNHRFRYSCQHTSRPVETQKCKYMEMLAEWLADDSPTPQIFRDLVTSECQRISTDSFEERNRVCGTCQIDARDRQERKEKMNGTQVHWRDEVEIGESSKDEETKVVEGPLMGRMENRQRDAGEGSSGGKEEEAGKEWCLENENDMSQDDEDVFVYEEKYAKSFSQDQSGYGDESGGD